MIYKIKNYAYVLFIDLAAAFHHVDRDLMFKTVCQRLTLTSNTKLIQLIELLFAIATILVQTPYGVFKLSMGVLQSGPVSSPFLNLILYLNFLDKCTNIGIKLLELKYRILASATYSKRTTV